MTQTRWLVLGALAALAVPAAPAIAQVKLNGAGATFPNIIYQDWMLSYNQTHPDVQLNYQSIGSGGGIRQFSDGTVDFGATDAPMKDSAIAAINGNVLHIPTVLGGDVPTYNLPDVKETLRFTPDVLADIFLGKITKWSDPRIAAFTRLLLRKGCDDAEKAAALVKFVGWAETEGQTKAEPCGYAPLPKQLRPWSEARLKTISAGGKPVWTTAARYPSNRLPRPP